MVMNLSKLAATSNLGDMAGACMAKVDTDSPYGDMCRVPPPDLARALGEGDPEWSYHDGLVDTGAASNFTGSAMQKYMVGTQDQQRARSVTSAGGQTTPMGPVGMVHTTFICPGGDAFNTPVHSSSSLSNMDVSWNIVEGFPTLFATNRLVKIDGWSMHPDLTGMSKMWMG
jgi:hypothetical protein